MNNSRKPFHMKITDINIGSRHRRDFGDIPALAASIADVGLLQPPAITHDGNLSAGMRRLEAVKQLGWAAVPVHIVAGLDEALDAIRGQRDENIQRKSFSISEAVSVGREIERLEKLAAQERQQAGRKRGGKARHENTHDREGDQSSLLENCQEAGRESTKLSGCE